MERCQFSKGKESKGRGNAYSELHNAKKFQGMSGTVYPFTKKYTAEPEASHEYSDHDRGRYYRTSKDQAKLSSPNYLIDKNRKTR